MMALHPGPACNGDLCTMALLLDCPYYPGQLDGPLLDLQSLIKLVFATSQLCRLIQDLVPYEIGPSSKVVLYWTCKEDLTVAV